MSLRGEGPRGSFLGEGRGGLLLSRFYFSKWLTFPVLGHKKVLVSIKRLKKCSPLLYSQFQFTNNNITRGGDSFTFARQEEDSEQ